MSQKSKILIVDDEPIGRQLLEAVLYTEGFDLVFAENGQQALDIAVADLPDLILMDVMMPEMDGFEVCRKVRKHEKAQKIPIILITALDDRDSRIRGLDAGADDYISKPFDRVEILAKVKNITQLNRYRQIVDTEGLVQEIKQDNKLHSTLQTGNYNLLYELNEPPVQFVKRFFPFFSHYPSANALQGKNLLWIDDNNQFICFAFISLENNSVSSDLGLIIQSLLNKAFKSGVIQKASDILNSLLKLVEEYKKKYDRRDLDITNGAISLLLLNKSNLGIQFSGYNLPIYIVNSEGITRTDFDQANDLSSVKEFTNHTYQMERNATICLLSKSLFTTLISHEKNNEILSELAMQIHNYPESFDQEVASFLEKKVEKSELADFSFITLKI